MPYRQFHDFFPEIAERETRTIIVPPGATKAALPVGEYGLVEMFCDERGCDCRRVFLAVMSKRRGPEAVIAWGWEPREFYARWSGEDDEILLDSLVGPALNLGSSETELAQPLLELVTGLVRTDHAYAVRIQEHYRMFRARVERKVTARGWFDAGDIRSRPKRSRHRR
ncbi:MAG: hypothetical protein AB7U23_14490 [Dehalococcoidia bacterium]